MPTLLATHWENAASSSTAAGSRGTEGSFRYGLEMSPWWFHVMEFVSLRLAERFVTDPDPFKT